MIDRVKYGNTYNFDLEPPLDTEYTEQVINQLLFHLRSLPEGETYTFDLRFGSDYDDASDWPKYAAKSRWIKRAYFKRDGKITREAVIDFLRESYMDVLTLPRPGLRRIK